MGNRDRRRVHRAVWGTALALLTIGIAGTAQARSETFRWLDANPLPSPVVSFSLHIGTSPGVYTTVVDVGMPTPDGNGVYSASIQVPDTDGVYVAMTAVDIDGRESTFSNVQEREAPPPIGSGATPNPSPDAYTTNQNTALDIGAGAGVLANDTDPEGDVLRAILVTTVRSGTLQLNTDGSFRYTPDPGFTGIDSFSYAASDGNSTSGPVAVTIEVLVVDDPLASSLMANWRLDEGTGSVAYDSSAGGHSGSVIGAGWVADTPMGSSSALSFDGVDDSVDLGNLDLGGQAVTISVWFKADSFGVHDARLISKATGTAGEDHYWMLSTIASEGGTRLRFRLKAGGTTSTLIASSGDLELDVWTHAAAVYDGATMRLFKDGVEVGSAPKSGAIATNPGVGVAIGNQPAGAGTQPFHGVIDDVRIWDQALAEFYLVDLTSGNASFDHASTVVQVSLTATGFDTPVYLTSPPGDSRLFVLEAGGRIFVVEDGSDEAMLFLDLSDDVSSDADGGLLSLAFDPEYDENGLFYVHRTALNRDSVLSRFSVSSNPYVADAESEEVILRLAQPFDGQNGGAIAFGPDEYLYVGLGDGGSTGDPGNRAQDGMSLLGKILRLDVGLPLAAGSIPAGAYGIPADNPFIGDAGVLDEVWALGLRHPYLFSFDRTLGDLWLADEGQGAREEINFEPIIDPGGNNFGWDVMEGALCNDDDPAPSPACGSGALVEPIHDYPHTARSCAITGGYVYRGSEQDLLGKYLFADFCSGEIFSLDAFTGQGTNWTAALGDAAGERSQIASFGEDGNGEIYVVHLNGDIYGIGAAAVVPEPASALLGAAALAVLVGLRRVRRLPRRS